MIRVRVRVQAQETKARRPNCYDVYSVLLLLYFRPQSKAGIPGGGLVRVGGPRAYQDQFRGFESHRVHARKDFFLFKN